MYFERHLLIFGNLAYVVIDDGDEDLPQGALDNEHVVCRQVHEVCDHTDIPTFIVFGGASGEKVGTEEVARDVREVLEISTKEKTEKKVAKKMNKQEREALIAELTAQMKEAAKLLEFEHAAFLRDKIRELQK